MGLAARWVVGERSTSTRRRAACLMLTLTLAACGLGSGGPHDAKVRPAGSALASRVASPALQASVVPRGQLARVVIPPDQPPSGMSLSDEGGGPAVLEQLPLFPETASQLQAMPGFVDGRWSRFAGRESDFQASRGFILTWVVQYESVGNARSAVAILLNELESDDHYGWGPGEDAGIGDEGTCLDGENPQMGGLEETICVWRRARLVMVVGGGIDNETPVQDEAAAMDTRAAELLP